MLRNLIGHEAAKKQLEIAIQSAQERNMSVPHILLSGLAGCGKTTMAMEIAKSMDVELLAVPPADMTDAKVVMTTLDKLNHDGYNKYGDRVSKIRPSILFFDEIHGMPRKGQEVLGITMEKFLLESGQKNKFYWIPYFTIIGATTDDGELTKPFREKFKLRFIFEAYSEKEMVSIVNLHALKNEIFPTSKAVREIARRSRGVPRFAVKYLDAIRDYASYKKTQIITHSLVLEAFKLQGVDSIGLTPTEVRILKTLYGAREPIGLDNLAIITNESAKNIKNTIEPFLIQKGLILRSGKGRVITEAGKKHLEMGGYVEGVSANKMEIDAGYVRK